MLCPQKGTLGHLWLMRRSSIGNLCLDVHVEIENHTAWAAFFSTKKMLLHLVTQVTRWCRVPASLKVAWVTQEPLGLSLWSLHVLSCVCMFFQLFWLGLAALRQACLPRGENWNRHVSLIWPVQGRSLNIFNDCDVKIIKASGWQNALVSRCYLHCCLVSLSKGGWQAALMDYQDRALIEITGGKKGGGLFLTVASNSLKHIIQRALWDQEAAESRGAALILCARAPLGFELISWTLFGELQMTLQS